MWNDFEFAFGSVRGREHRLAGRNNQDDGCLIETNQAVVGVVADGCGSARRSEIGAGLGVRWTAQAILRHLESFCTSDLRVQELDRDPAFPFWEGVRHDILSRIRLTAEDLGTRLIDEVEEFFLFTLIGFVLTEKATSFFSIGDGIIGVNERLNILGPFRNNAPPYIAYGLGLHDSRLPSRWCFQIHESCPTAEIKSLMVATDGAEHLIKAADRPFPGKTKCIGPISRLTEEDRFFKNPDILRRHLSLANEDVTRVNPETGDLEQDLGVLPDDTSLIIGRRKP